MERKKPNRKDLIYPELSYEIVGALLDVYSQLGHGLYEKTYQKAVSIAFQKRGFKFTEQVYSPIVFEGERVGTNFFDFLVEKNGQVALVELKRGNKFVKAHIDQVYNYLCSKNLQLGILAYFGPQQLHYKRIVNVLSS